MPTPKSLAEELHIDLTPDGTKRFVQEMNSAEPLPPRTVSLLLRRSRRSSR